MDLQDNLIECSNRKRRGGWKATLAALGVHGVIIGFVLLMTAATTHKITAEDKPIKAFVVSAAAPPPPPPPPPPAPAPAASHPAPQHVIKPVEIPKQTFVQPREVPHDVPKVEVPVTTEAIDTTPATTEQPAAEPGGVPGGRRGAHGERGVPLRPGRRAGGGRPHRAPPPPRRRPARAPLLPPRSAALLPSADGRRHPLTPRVRAHGPGQRRPRGQLVEEEQSRPSHPAPGGAQ